MNVIGIILHDIVWKLDNTIKLKRKKYPQSFFILDIALLISTWKLIHDMIECYCLLGLTQEMFEFYDEHMESLVLPENEAIVDYNAYINDRQIIWKNLRIEMKKELGDIQSIRRYLGT